MIRKFAIAILFILISCQGSDLINIDSAQPELTLDDTFNLPLDTTRIITLLDMNIKDKISDFDSHAYKLDTIELVSANFACDCQDWVTDEYRESHDLGKYGYFIEPFNDEILLSENFGVFDNRIKLIGTWHFENDMHLNTKLSDTIRVFTYYSYEVLLPAKVYGPLYHSGKTELTGSTGELIQRSVITVKN